MKKTFTRELITAIIEATNRLVANVPKNTTATEKLLDAASGGVTLEEVVDGVTLTVVVREEAALGFGEYPRRTLSVSYGKMTIAYGLNVGVLDDSYQTSALRIIMSSCLGESQEHVDMQKLATMISKQTAVQAITSGSILGSLTLASPVDFKVELPGGVVFERAGSTLSVTKGEENIYVLSSTVPQVIEQHMSQAATLAIHSAGSITTPARTVDTSVETALLNGVLYLKTGDKSIAYYFDDERTKDFVARQAGQRFQQGLISDPNQQLSGLYRPGYNGY